MSCLSVEKEGFKIRSLAQYIVRARVLSKERYWFDHGAKLSPWDLAIGWGPMSDSAVLDRLSMSQGTRFYNYSPRGGRNWPIPIDEINENSANTHMIPANDQVRKTLGTVHAGQIVAFSGYLVEVTGPGGERWRSSLSRTDKGNGACELVWVENLEIEN